MDAASFTGITGLWLYPADAEPLEVLAGSDELVYATADGQVGKVAPCGWVKDAPGTLS